MLVDIDSKHKPINNIASACRGPPSNLDSLDVPFPMLFPKDIGKREMEEYCSNCSTDIVIVILFR